MPLTTYEQETIICFNRGEPTAHIFTCEKTWQKHLENNLGLKPLYKNHHGGKEYEIDKKRIRPPRAPVKLSASEKAKRAKRLKDSRQKSFLSKDFP